MLIVVLSRYLHWEMKVVQFYLPEEEHQHIGTLVPAVGEPLKTLALYHASGAEEHELQSLKAHHKITSPRFFRAVIKITLCLRERHEPGAAAVAVRPSAPDRESS
jgi:hypothetical protein